MATFWAFPPQTFTAWDANGDPVPGAKAYVYEAGTATPLTVYTDSALTTPHANPIVADANGTFAPIYINGSQAIKIDITDASDVQLPRYPVDNITGIPFGGLTAANITFVPTATLSASDVQAALEALDAINQIAAVSYFPEVETAGSSNAYSLNAAGTVSSYVNETIFVLRADRDNTGAATLNIDGVGAKAWKQHDGSAYVDFAAGEIRDGDQHWVEYDSGADEFHSVFIRRRRATQAEAEAGTAVGPYMDALRVSQAITALAKDMVAFVKFDGDPVSILASYGVSSITDNGAGDYDVNFSTAFGSASYISVATVQDSTDLDVNCQIKSQSASACNLITRDDGTNTLIDCTAVHAMFTV